MLITPTTKTVTEYALTLSETDAAQCFVAPYEFAERIAAELRAAGAVPATNGNGHHKPGPDHPLGFKAHAARKAKARKAARVARPAKAGRPNGEKGGPSLERLQCPHCSRKIARKFFPKHLATKHPGQASTVSAAESASTN